MSNEPDELAGLLPPLALMEPRWVDDFFTGEWGLIIEAQRDVSDLLKIEPREVTYSAESYGLQMFATQAMILDAKAEDGKALLDSLKAHALADAEAKDRELRREGKYLRAFRVIYQTPPVVDAPVE